MTFVQNKSYKLSAVWCSQQHQRLHANSKKSCSSNSQKFI